MSEKCKNCGACKECGAPHQIVYVYPPYFGHTYNPAPYRPYVTSGGSTTVSPSFPTSVNS